LPFCLYVNVCDFYCVVKELRGINCDENFIRRKKPQEKKKKLVFPSCALEALSVCLCGTVGSKQKPSSATAYLRAWGEKEVRSALCAALFRSWLSQVVCTRVII